MPISGYAPIEYRPAVVLAVEVLCRTIIETLQQRELAGLFQSSHELKLLANASELLDLCDVCSEDDAPTFSWQCTVEDLAFVAQRFVADCLRNGDDTTVHRLRNVVINSLPEAPTQYLRDRERFDLALQLGCANDARRIGRRLSMGDDEVEAVLMAAGLADR